ncbi:hypothetical protein EV2_000201 [Malus domestica]
MNVPSARTLLTEAPSKTCDSKVTQALPIRSWDHSSKTTSQRPLPTFSKITAWNPCFKVMTGRSGNLLNPKELGH